MHTYIHTHIIHTYIHTSVPAVTHCYTKLILVFNQSLSSVKHKTFPHMQTCLWAIPSLAEPTSPSEQLAETGLSPLLCPTTKTQLTK
jgi:hypothetical protein